MRKSNRLYILDTNVLMHDPTSLFRFEEHNVYLPMVVLEELDAAKKGLSEVARNVRQVSRFIGEMILPDGRILNRELVRHGFAWHYRVHYPVDESLRELEYQAWKKKVGLWVDPLAVPPWEFRIGSSTSTTRTVSVGTPRSRP